MCQQLKALIALVEVLGPIPCTLCRHGRPSDTWRFVEPLTARLRRAYPDKEVVLCDERFTSVLAHRAMLESGIGRTARRDKALVDKISATIILQSYMEFNK